MVPAALLAQAHGIISDELLHPPDYNTFQPPAQVGESYLDPVFHTRVTRLTNCDRFETYVLGGYFTNSEICFFNVDGSYFIAMENDSLNNQNLILTFLYDGRTCARLTSTLPSVRPVARGTSRTMAGTGAWTAIPKNCSFTT